MKAIVLLWSLLMPLSGVTPKAKSISAALNVMARIDSAAGRLRDVDNAVLERQIATLIGGKRPAAELERIAVLSYYMAYPQRAGEDTIDRVYEASFWECVRRLGAMRSTDGRAALRLLQSEVRLQGGDLLRFKDLTR